MPSPLFRLFETPERLLETPWRHRRAHLRCLVGCHFALRRQVGPLSSPSGKAKSGRVGDVHARNGIPAQLSDGSSAIETRSQRTNALASRR